MQSFHSRGRSPRRRSSGLRSALAAYPYYSLDPYPTVTLPYPTVPANKASTWNLLDGYLRVEYRDANGVYHPVTQEWLGLGFARGSTPPTAIGTNPVNPNAILIFQEPADRNRDGVLDSAGAPPGYTAKCTKKNLAVPASRPPTRRSPASLPRSPPTLGYSALVRRQHSGRGPAKPQPVQLVSHQLL